MTFNLKDFANKLGNIVETVKTMLNKTAVMSAFARKNPSEYSAYATQLKPLETMKEQVLELTSKGYTLRSMGNVPATYSIGPEGLSVKFNHEKGTLYTIKGSIEQWVDAIARKYQKDNSKDNENLKLALTELTYDQCKDYRMAYNRLVFKIADIVAKSNVPAKDEAMLTSLAESLSNEMYTEDEYNEFVKMAQNSKKAKKK